MPNAEQIEYWNGEAGKRWAQDDATMAGLLQPITDALLEHAAPEGCGKALDVGCGGGSQSLLLARRLGQEAQVLGVDISLPMLDVARSKLAEPDTGRASLEFLQADAATYAFKRGSFDLLFSRFGVMFFDDPLMAFSNLNGALRAGGRMAFCCWQSMKANDWTRIPFQAALQHLPAPEPPPPNAPGPFALADKARTESILAEAGFSDIDIQPFSTALRLSEEADLADAVRELARIGPVSRLLEGQPEALLNKVFPAMEDALQPHYKDRALDLQAAVWFVTAARP